MLIQFLLELSILLALCFLGTTIATAITPYLSKGYKLSIAFPLGGGMFTYLLFLLSWAGIRLDAKTIVLSYSGLLLLAMLVYLLVWLKEKDQPWKENGFKFGNTDGLGHKDILVFLMITTLTLIAAYLAVSRSYSTWDAMGIWSIKGIGIAYEGTIYAASHWGSHGLSYPLNIPLQIAIFRIMGEELIPGSKLIFPIFYLSLLLGVFATAKKRIGGKDGLLIILLLGTTPFIFEHATIGYANLAFTTYIVLGLVSLMQGMQDENNGAGLIGGLLLGLAGWTRPEGVFLIIPIMIVVYLGVRNLDQVGKPRFQSWFLPPLMITGLWQIFMIISGSRGIIGEALQNAWLSLQAGDMNLAAFYWTARYALRQVIDPGVWGLIVPASILALILNRRRLAFFRSHALIFLLIPAAVGGLSLFAYYYLASFRQDIHYLLGTSVNRLFMPVWVIGFLGFSILGMEVDKKANPEGQL